MSTKKTLEELKESLNNSLEEGFPMNREDFHKKYNSF